MCDENFNFVPNSPYFFIVEILPPRFTKNPRAEKETSSGVPVVLSAPIGLILTQARRIVPGRMFSPRGLVSDCPLPHDPGFSGHNLDGALDAEFHFHVSERCRSNLTQVNVFSFAHADVAAARQ